MRLKCRHPVKFRYRYPRFARSALITLVILSLVSLYAIAAISAYAKDHPNGYSESAYQVWIGDRTYYCNSVSLSDHSLTLIDCVNQPNTITLTAPLDWTAIQILAR